MINGFGNPKWRRRGSQGLIHRGNDGKTNDEQLKNVSRAVERKVWCTAASDDHCK